MPPRVAVLLVATLWSPFWVGCKSVNAPSELLAPSNHRDWEPSLAVPPTAEVSRRRATIHNVRRRRHLDPGTYVVDYYDKTIPLDRLRGVDFIVSPFGPVPALAHTMLSFEFVGEAGEPEFLTVSVEVRKERGETYQPLLGLARQYELIYVIADERDALGGRVLQKNEDLYVYRTRATPDDARDLLVDILERANRLAKKPEFYHLVTNNCTTNLADHLNRIKPDRVAYDLGILLPGLSDRKAFATGLLAGEGTFEQIKARAHINDRARLAADSDGFSQAIRR